jgi:hypothetical protein
MTDKKPSSDDSSLAALLGAGYAHVQHWMDLGIEWGLKRMEDASKAAPAKGAREPGKAERIGRGILGFLGGMGSAYYATYEKLKKERKS